MVLLAFVLFAQTQAGTPERAPRPGGCAALSMELADRLALTGTGQARAREACYEALGRGYSTSDVAHAMHAFAAEREGTPPPAPETATADAASATVASVSETAPPGDAIAWTSMLPVLHRGPLLADADEPMLSFHGLPRVENVGVFYWGSCDGHGAHGACDQMGLATFRLRSSYWVQMRYFDFYSGNGDTAGAIGLGVDARGDFVAWKAGVWIGTWAHDCDLTSCGRGSPFVLPYGDVRVGSPTIFVDAGVLDGPYVASGHARLELGHEFLGGSRVEAGATVGVLGHGAAARADTRLMLFRHLALDLYASLGVDSTTAFGAGLGIRY